MSASLWKRPKCEVTECAKFRRVQLETKLGRNALDARFPARNQVMYSAGRTISVRIVATNRPPVIANATGPQNTVGAIGI